MSDDRSARLDLPLLQPGQAQKELYHNEALSLLDLAVQAAVVAVGINAPPASPAPGDCWIVGGSPVGAWSGAARALAGWTSGGWRFVRATEGMAVWSSADGARAVYSGGSWSVGTIRGQRLVIDGLTVVAAQRAAIADPLAGGTIDAEARAAIGAILTALRGHGLIAS